MARRSLDLIEAMYAAAKAAQPITGRGIGYKLFTTGLIPSMAGGDAACLPPAQGGARAGDIPWGWIVDETRALERTSTWDDPAEYASCVAQSYRRDFWNQQLVRVRSMERERHRPRRARNRYSTSMRSASALCMDLAAQRQSTTSPNMTTGVRLIVLYVGDYDPSGLYMSEHDLPDRLAKYGGDHVTLKRIALTREHTDGLPPFPASDKTERPEATNGSSAITATIVGSWMHSIPMISATLVEEAIRAVIEPIAWERCELINRAEQESLKTIIAKWAAP